MNRGFGSNGSSEFKLVHHFKSSDTKPKLWKTRFRMFFIDKPWLREGQMNIDSSKSWNLKIFVELMFFQIWLSNFQLFKQVWIFWFGINFSRTKFMKWCTILWLLSLRACMTWYQRQLNWEVYFRKGEKWRCLRE